MKDKNQINSKYEIVRLQTEEQNKCLGTKIGQFVEIQQEGNNMKSLFKWPISRIDDIGIVDLIQIKDDENNQASEQKYVIKGPYTNYIYEGYGNIKYQNNGVAINKNIQFMGIICQNIDIMNVFQLVEGICTNGDPTNISLLHFCDSLEDAVLLDELLWLKEEQKLSYKLLLKEVNPTFINLKGAINSDFVQDFMPPHQENSLILVAGDNEFQNKSQQILNNIGFQDDQILKIGEQDYSQIIQSTNQKKEEK